MLRTNSKHVKTALYAMAYGASKRKVKRILTRHRKMTARQAASAVKWAEFTLYSSYR
ncbi:hypothetical protein EMP27_17 [Klebsiella phage vB_KpnP_Emp27]|uniref:Uncharacterized protein n=3 Tax=Teetrevirus TaxID=2732693 RepID=A0A5B9NLS5_9CAUD|nr:hypothetical protein EMP27_17 [Klebsiella phage vB_KpnP_Emp27]WCS66927.1 hypothetical protein HMGUsm2_350 [Serratia phage HMGUsm2]CAK6604195.1 unknown function [Klebsiella phage vB_Kpn_K19PH14C4P1]